MTNRHNAAGLILAILLGTHTVSGQTLPVRHDRSALGRYPGDPKENFAPSLTADGATRNIALHRAAFGSESYDYNLTPQLITDGIISLGDVPTLTVRTQEGLLPRRGREGMLDFGEFSNNEFEGSDIWYEISTRGYSICADSIAIVGRILFTNKSRPQSIKAICLGSDDGKKWNKAGEAVSPIVPPSGMSAEEWALDPNKQTGATKAETMVLNQSIGLKGSKRYKYWKIMLEAKGVEGWMITQTNFYANGTSIDIKPSNHFHSVWLDSGNDEPWVAVDLGNRAELDEVILHWQEAPESGTIEISDNGKDWTPAASYRPGENSTTHVSLTKGLKARYVKTAMTRRPSSQPIAIAEMEVMGRGGMTAQPAERPAPSEGKASLSGGKWTLWRDAGEEGTLVATPAFNPSNAIQATVPATILSSHVNAGAIADPNFADAENMISDSYFNSDFWYRTEFELPSEMEGKEVMLNFDGINWKAEVYLNGEDLGGIEGAFKRGVFDVTDRLLPGKNILAVKIIKNAHQGSIKEKSRENPGFNGGVLGADNPTFHASIGWDWISTIRGRNDGIWNDVFLSATGPAGVSDPLVETTLTDCGATADVTAFVIVTNHTERPVEGTLKGTIGNVEFEKRVALLPSESKEVAFSPDEFPQLRIKEARLWWPNGYGEAYLHPASFAFISDGATSDTLSYEAGLREMTYGEGPEGRLDIYVNGQRFVGRGGNWGMSEANLNFRGREYDAAVAYHKDMNMNIIRNWVGMTGDEEFYEACDRHGIMVWQDFWLANPADGPDPADNGMFMDNARDYIRRIRRHPSLALYCGRNEGNPPAALDSALREAVGDMHPGLRYISNSADNGVSGHGPYRMLDAKEYFTLQSGNNTFHTERGMPNVLTYESMERTYSPEALADFTNKEWGMHDYTLEGAQGATSFNQLIATLYGEPSDVRDFSRKAQMVNYDGHRAMFESRSLNRQGLLMWMSHSCWPSMVWQTYDYFFEPTAGYFGIKKASEPLHIQWNPATDNVEVVNYSLPDADALTATARILDLDGSVIWEQEAIVDSKTDTTLAPIHMDLPQFGPGLRIIDLTLRDGDDLISSNRYFHSGEPDGNRQALNTLPALKLSHRLDIAHEGDDKKGYVTVTNEGDHIVPYIRLNLIGKADRMQILPAIYADNYFMLLPGETRRIEVAWKESDSRGQEAEVIVESLHFLE